MGLGYRFSCSCGYRSGALIGYGSSFPQIYRKLMDRARTGDLGKAVKKLCARKHFAAIDADMNLYRCPKCDHLEPDFTNDIYYPLDKKYVTERSKKLDGEPYFYGGELQKYFKLEYKYPHICSKCQEALVMVDLSGRAEIVLDCPRCGERLQVGLFSWD